MGKGCDFEGCEGEHHAKGKCKLHYKMPSQLNPKPISRSVSFSAPQNKPQERVFRKERSKPKDKVLTLPQLLEKTEKVFNKWIRIRDLMSDNTFLCISCQKWKPKSEGDAGHYFSKTYSVIRFHEDNVHLQCVECNRMKHGNFAGYMDGLMAKIGIERMQILAHLKNQAFKWDREYLEYLIKRYS